MRDRVTFGVRVRVMVRVDIRVMVRVGRLLGSDYGHRKFMGYMSS